MGVYEKVLGLGMVPFLFLVLILLASGILSRQMHGLVNILLSMNFKINNYTVYFFPMVAVLNMILIIAGYLELEKMHIPSELAAKTKYYEELYRTYRNFLLNLASAIMILQIFISGRAYKKYQENKDKLARMVKAK